MRTGRPQLTISFIDERVLKTLPVVVLILGLTGCDWWGQRQAEKLAQAPETQARVKALVDKSLKQLSPVQGGGFWLGDFGVLMDDHAKQNDIAPRSDAKPGENLPFTIDEDNKPPKWVELDGFSIQQYKVTYGDFDVYVTANALPVHPPKGVDDGFHRTWQRARTADDVPAGVTWHQAKGYCQWLGKVTGLPFDLPTEAQWEYAASNRTNSYRHPFPTDTGLLEKGRTHPTFKQKEALTGNGALYPVGRYSASPLGLHDLVGNGFEWMNDWYAADAYRQGTAKNPQGPATGSEKVLRGMPTDEDFVAFRHLSRYHNNPATALSHDGKKPFPFIWEGFRCAVNQWPLRVPIK
jgi:sulfatase modifying factor 1